MACLGTCHELFLEGPRILMMIVFQSFPLIAHYPSLLESSLKSKKKQRKHFK